MNFPYVDTIPNAFSLCWHKLPMYFPYVDIISMCFPYGDIILILVIIINFKPNFPYFGVFSISNAFTL